MKPAREGSDTTYSKRFQGTVDSITERTNLLAALGKRNPKFLEVLVKTQMSTTALLQLTRETEPKTSTVRNETKFIGNDGGDSISIAIISKNNGEVVFIGLRASSATVQPIPTRFLQTVFLYYQKELANRSLRP